VVHSQQLGGHPFVPDHGTLNLLSNNNWYSYTPWIVGMIGYYQYHHVNSDVFSLIVSAVRCYIAISHAIINFSRNYSNQI